ncbi:MAG: glycoside hydrolase family 99-like domain-containing protein [Rhizobiales bacterium]|nr:glycoside hydrolase family 99-like domain-containing protein [Hyphomicrobiales bacterium]
MTNARAEAAKYFDEQFYLAQYPEVAAAGVEPLGHYLEKGWIDNKDPSPEFSTSDYLSLYPDVRDLGMNPLVHFALHGHAEGRQPKRGVYKLKQASSARLEIDKALHAGFDEEYYLKCYPEVRRSELSPFDHFMQLGWQEGRNPSRDFDTNYYLASHEDVRKSGINPYFHYIAFGRSEARKPTARWRRLKASEKPAAETPPSPVQALRQDVELRLIRGTGLFDARYYAAANKDLAALSDDKLLDHYYFNGWREGRSPSFVFDTKWYLDESGLTSTGAVNPLVHYIEEGARKGLRPAPWFDARWYAKRYKIAPNSQPALQHYMQVGARQFNAPNAVFDSLYYLNNNPDVKSEGADPTVHYFTRGYLERRKPSAVFDSVFYCGNYGLAASEDPVIHYLLIGRARGYRINADMEPGAGGVYETAALSTRPSPAHEERNTSVGEGRIKRARAIAFYLPQFHPIAENDVAWGRGFTEWRNTSRGLPRFEGHYQPRIPEELGYYDLEQSDTMARQIAMAKAAGLEGFCFYYYWFNGKRVLEKPVDRFLADRSLDMPFAIMWANENWTRRWDGLDTEIVLHQDYRHEDEAALIDDLQRHFADPRYIRVTGRPLFIIYRPGIVPEARKTFARWRALWQSRHGENPLILMVQAFDDYDPRVYDLDGAVEFPPHKVAAGLTSIIDSVTVLDSEFARKGMVLSYDQLVGRSVSVAPPAFPLLRGVMPSWDNEARRRGRGVVYHGSTPRKYEDWLRRMSCFARQHPFHGEPMVFVNAWNEWAEAAYLEPDLHFGAAYLNATARALTHNAARSAKEKVLVISHDAHPHGAQINAMHMAMVLDKQFGLETVILSLGDGSMLPKFGEVTETHQASPRSSDFERLVAELADRGFNLALANTTVSGPAIPTLKRHGFRVVSLVHELPRLMRDYRLEEAATTISAEADRIVFAAREVRDGFASVASESAADKFVIRPQGNYRTWLSRPAESRALRRSLGLTANDKLVINVGYADARKGFDIFLNAAKIVIAKRNDVHFLWVGGGTPDVQTWLTDDIAADPQLARRFNLRPFVDDVVPYFEAGDLFFLSSREDPFPTAVLEAMRAGLPLVGLSGSGGSVGLIARHGILADRSDMVAIVQAIETLLDAPAAERQAWARDSVATIERDFRFDDYVYDLTQLLGVGQAKVTAIVPNYNYGSFISSRLDSIYAQTHPLFETIVLDDKSTDDSREQIDAYAFRTGRQFRVEVNDSNSGSGYRQWEKGAALARGDYVWIAEADDLSDPTFLDCAMSVLENSKAALVFTDSHQIDETGASLAHSYHYYYKDLGEDALTSDAIIDGAEFVRRYLAVKNVILNVSSVVWRREALLHVLEITRADHLTMRVACDWKMYALAALECGPVGFIAAPLNVHRRHSQSVTHARKADAHYQEIVAVQEFIAARVELDDATLVRREAYRKEVKDYLERQAAPLPVIAPAKGRDASGSPRVVPIGRRKARR